jgi:hypothetical protein
MRKKRSSTRSRPVLVSTLWHDQKAPTGQAALVSANRCPQRLSARVTWCCSHWFHEPIAGISEASSYLCIALLMSLPRRLHAFPFSAVLVLPHRARPCI